jgi:hypothetical protein
VVCCHQQFATRDGAKLVKDMVSSHENQMHARLFPDLLSPVYDVHRPYDSRMGVVRIVYPAMGERTYKFDCTLESTRSTARSLGTSRTLSHSAGRKCNLWWLQYDQPARALYSAEADMSATTIHIFHQTCNASACEGNWSEHAMVHTDSHIQLGKKRVEKLVYVRGHSVRLRRTKLLPQDHYECVQQEGAAAEEPNRNEGPLKE